jgi:hypothetical protein
MATAPTLPAPAAESSARPERRRGTRTRSRRLPAATTLESFGVFLAFFAVYFGIGYHVVVDLHLVNFDALSRLAHAYFVWWNEPPKLAAIGFVWPPVQTLIYMPFALIKPLATSLAALPAASATFMAALMVVLNKSMRFAEMRWFARLPLLIVFGLNPMVVYYGANGMAEAVYLFFLGLGIYFLLRWNLSRRTHMLAMVGIALALAMLARYEILPFALVIGTGIAAITMAGRERVYRPQELEGSLLLYLAPIAYAGGAWLFFNWLILGNPLSFLEFGATSADIGTTQQDIAGLAARDLGPIELAEYMLALNWALFPLAVLVVPALLFTAVSRRDMMSLVLAALVVTNAAVTMALFLRTVDPNLVQLRYNMRAIPIALIAVGWLYYRWRERPVRVGIWVAALAALLVSLPITWQTMERYSYQYEENVFLRALETGKDQEGNIGIGGYPIGIADERAIADYIDENVTADEVIFTDDAQTLGIMLLTGKPDLFFDRIDRGDTRWTEELNDPWGNVDYFLVTTDERCRAPCLDQVRERYPGVLRDRFPGLRVVFRTRQYVLVAVDEEAPTQREIDRAASQP